VTPSSRPDTRGAADVGLPGLPLHTERRDGGSLEPGELHLPHPDVSLLPRSPTWLPAPSLAGRGPGGSAGMLLQALAGIGAQARGEPKKKQKQSIALFSLRAGRRRRRTHP
jgi:hypothetical protein